MANVENSNNTTGKEIEMDNKNIVENKIRLAEALLDFIERGTKEPSTAYLDAIPRTAEVLIQLWNEIDISLRYGEK